MTLTPCTQDISYMVLYVWWLSLSSLPSEVRERERIASTWLCWWPGGGRDKIIYVMGIQILNWQELIAKEAFPSNFVTFTQETGCQNFSFCAVQWTTPLRVFFSSSKNCLARNFQCWKIIFLFFSDEKKKRTISAHEKTKSSGSMMQPRPARQWTLQLVSSWASKAARVSDKLGILRIAT